MDRTNNGAAGRSQDHPGGAREWDAGGRSSVESQSSKLQKKRSTGGVRNASHPLPPVTGRRASVLAGHGKQRKGSLRNAVRKIFGRRSKDLEGSPPCVSPRHAYHRSESHALSPPPEEAEPRSDHGIPHRTRSAPLQAHPAAIAPRTRSAYAVEFPRSARLKPLDLGSPLPTPMSALKRRKTLPTILPDDGPADGSSRSIPSSEAPPLPDLAIDRDAAASPDAMLATYGAFNPKRRSRSADDLKGALTSHRPSLPRKRSEEIRYWRGSVQPSVLRESGLSGSVRRSEDIPPEEPRPGDPTPTVGPAHPSDAVASRPASPARRAGLPPLRADASVAAGPELSRDLEDRVAKLEAGLQSFQQSLQRLTSERTRPPVAVGTVPHGRRNSTDARTPSMLADTLSRFGSPAAAAAADDDDPSDLRPSTSPTPSTPTRSTAPPSSHPDQSPHPHHPRRRHHHQHHHSPSRLIPPPPSGRSSASSRPPPHHPKLQDYTFRSLYEMLADERSARRNLERQLRGLRAEIHDLSHQVSSVQHSQRSSSLGAPPSVVVDVQDPMVGSSRLQRLLVDDEEEEVGLGLGLGGVGSRFSGSESGVGEGGSRESLAMMREGEGAMF